MGATAPIAPPPGYATARAEPATVGQGEAKTAQNSIWFTVMSKLPL